MGKKIEYNPGYRYPTIFSNRNSNNMEKKTEYNPVYGYLPVDIVNHLPEIDRLKLIANWMRREPTNAGWVVTASVINQLGKDFLEYIFDRVNEMEDEIIQSDPQAFAGNLKYLLEGFASDVNTLYEFVNDYIEEMDHQKLKDTLDKILFQDEPQQEKCDIKVKKDPEDKTLSPEKKSTEKKKTNKSTKKSAVVKKQPRDSKGRFLKKK